MFLRIVSAVIFSVAGGFAGISFSEHLKSNLELCHKIQEMFLNSKIIIRCRADDVYAIATEFKNNKSFEKLTFLNELPEKYSPEEDFHEMWSSAVESQKSIPDDIKKILFDFGAVLGQSDIEGQLASIDAISENAEVLEKKYSEMYSQKGKLYRSVGLLFGVMIGILII